MDYSKWEIIPVQVKNGSITTAEGAKKLMELVFLNKYMFSFRELNEDEFSDFLIYELPKLKDMLEKRKWQDEQFTAFLFAKLENNCRTWKKKNIRKIVTEESNSITQELDYEESLLKYHMPEEDLLLNEEQSLYEPIDSPEPPEKSESIENTTKLLEELELSFSSQKTLERLRKDAILILALKSSYFLDEQTIRKVSHETGFSENEIKILKAAIMSKLNNKIKRREACIRCRDNAYFFHKKYLMESIYIKPESSWAHTIKTRYRKQTKTWMKKNEELENNSYSVSANNSLVGRVLGISPRHIHYIIKQVEKNIDILKPNEYHINHENLFGNRKFE